MQHLGNHAAALVFADAVEARAVVFVRLQHKLFFSTCQASYQVYSFEFAVSMYPCRSQATKAPSLSTVLLPGATL